MKVLLLSAVCGFVFVLGSGAVRSEECSRIERPKSRLACFDAVAACLGQPDPEARLACYDAATETATGSDSGTAATTSDLEEPFPVPGARRPERDDARVHAKVIDVALDHRQRRHIELDNGQVWREVSPGRLRIEEGVDIVIRRGVLGSVNLYLQESGAYIKVRRVR